MGSSLDFRGILLENACSLSLTEAYLLFSIFTPRKN
jgi:hypothetical protein